MAIDPPVRTYCGAVVPRDEIRWPERGTGPIYCPVCGECNEAAGFELDRPFDRLDQATAHIAVTDLYQEGHHLVRAQ